MVGDRILVEWPMSDNSFKALGAKVVHIKKCKILKHNSLFKYTLLFDDGDSLKTRLNHLKWKLDTPQPRCIVKSEGECSVNPDTTISALSSGLRPKLPVHKYVLAPMVGGSELPFRLLCRKYGVQLAYTPMMNSDRFVADEAYREMEFQSNNDDRPLVAHFSGNNPKIMLAAAKIVENKCDAIDLNLGCPQRIAFTGHFGSYLLDEKDRSLVLEIIHTLASNLTIPVFVKIRLLDELDDTIKLCKQLAEAGNHKFKQTTCILKYFVSTFFSLTLSFRCLHDSNTCSSSSKFSGEGWTWSKGWSSALGTS